MQLHLPSETLHRVLQNFFDADPALFEMPSTLRSVDPVIQHVMLSLAAALGAGASDLYAETAREFLIAHLWCITQG